MTRIGIILGSTRQGRRSETVANWVLEHVVERTDAEFELVDLRDFPLPFFDGAISPAHAPSSDERIIAWSAKIRELDGFIFVTPEYNHSTSGVLKNAIDSLYPEWNNKVAAFVGYGGVGGARAVEHLRLIAAEVEMATVRHQVALSMLTDFVNYTELAPAQHQTDNLGKALDQLIAWTNALAPLREEVSIAQG